MRKLLATAALGALIAVGGSASAQRTHGTSLDMVMGQPLLALDGSQISLEPMEDGLRRVTVSPTGQTERRHFAFLARGIGTITDPQSPNQVLGVFRIAGDAIDAEFADGHDETLSANDDGGLTLTVKKNDAPVYCMSWYPKDHNFSEAERKAALAQYAKRLGLAVPATDVGESIGCETPSVAAHPKVQPAVDKSAAAAALPPAKQIDVRASVVHPIDMPPALMAAATAFDPQRDANADQDVPARSDSDCLVVDSDGHHWGFRNRCGFPVQFAYCLKEGDEPLSACGNGTVPGSVEPKGFAALIADRSLSESDASHRFRWVACHGGAGEVIAQMDRTEPPAGRCIRAHAS